MYIASCCHQPFDDNCHRYNPFLFAHSVTHSLIGQWYYPLFLGPSLHHRSTKISPNPAHLAAKLVSPHHFPSSSWLSIFAMDTMMMGPKRKVTKPSQSQVGWGPPCHSTRYAARPSSTTELRAAPTPPTYNRVPRRVDSPPPRPATDTFPPAPSSNDRSLDRTTAPSTSVCIRACSIDQSSSGRPAIHRPP
jgi:hypothetical protein